MSKLYAGKGVHVIDFTVSVFLSCNVWSDFYTMYFIFRKLQKFLVVWQLSKINLE
jgi:hypothetical protein